MTPWESLLKSNNGSSIIKQLALIAFFVVEYISKLKTEIAEFADFIQNKCT